MGLVNPSQSAAGEEINAADINDPINQLAAVINGSIDTNNLAASAVATTNLADAAVTEAKMTSRPSEFLADFIYSGGAVAQSAGLTGTFSNIVYYIGGIRYTATSVPNKTYTASKDTYVDIGTDGTVDYNEVANGAASPSLSASHIRVAKVVTSGAAITSVVQVGSDSLGNLIYNNDANKQNAWRTWTPTLTNFTGTVNYAKYIVIGKTCHFYIDVTQGASVTGRHTFSLPVTASTSITQTFGWGVPIARGLILDLGTQAFDAFGGILTTTTCGLGYMPIVSSIVTQAVTSATLPMAWANASDKFWLYGSYEVA